MRSNFKILLCLILIFSLAACNDEPKQQDFDKTDINSDAGLIMLSGTITDQKNGEPVEGANVAINGKSVMTDKEGNYQLKVIKSNWLKYDISHKNYGTLIEISSFSRKTKRDFSLRKKSEIIAPQN